MEKRVITVEWLAEALLFWSWGTASTHIESFFGGGGGGERICPF